MGIPVALMLSCASLVAFGQAASPVPGAPFSADVVTIRTETLAGGKTREIRAVSKIYRDSSGRLWQDITPRENAPPGMAPIAIMITDPVAGALYALETPTRIAHHLALPKESAGFGYGIPFPAGQTSPKGKPEFKSESLGTQTMQGVEVEGIRITATYAPESPGGKTLVSINERWISKDAAMAVLLKQTDLHGGTATQRLENIERKEPDASLFLVPPDYRVEEMQ